MPSGVFKPAGPDDPGDTEDGATVAKGLDYLQHGNPGDPKNHDKTRGWLAKMNAAVERTKARNAAHDAKHNKGEGKKGK